MENSKSNRHVIFSDAPPMIKQKSWDDTDFLKENTWTKSHISKRKERKKSNEEKSTRKERHNLNKNYRLSKLREANSGYLSQNSQNSQNNLSTKKQDLAKEESREQKYKSDLIKEEQYKQELLLKHQQIQKLLEEKQKQTQTREIPVTNEPVIEQQNLKNKGKWHKIKKTFKNIFKNGGRKRTRKSRTRKLHTRRNN
jgi:hypothetical protein